MRFAWMMWGLVALTPVVETTVAHAAELSATDPLVVSLDAEAAAADDLVLAIKKEVREGRLDLTVDAKLSWQRFDRAWKDIAAWGQEGDWEKAYRNAPAARALAERGANEAFSVRASRPLKQAMTRYLDASEPRVGAVRDRLARLRDDRKMDQWRRAKATYEVAKELAAVGRYRDFWPTLANAVALLDELAIEVAFGRDLEVSKERR